MIEKRGQQYKVSVLPQYQEKTQVVSSMEKVHYWHIL